LPGAGGLAVPQTEARRFACLGIRRHDVARVRIEPPAVSTIRRIARVDPGRPPT